jgi:hypothetical protein
MNGQPPEVEHVLVFAFDWCYAKAAYADYCFERGDDGVRRRLHYIDRAEELRRWRREPDNPRQVVLFAGDWYRGAARNWRFLMEMRQRGFTE